LRKSNEYAFISSLLAKKLEKYSKNSQGARPDC